MKFGTYMYIQEPLPNFRSCIQYSCIENSERIDGSIQNVNWHYEKEILQKQQQVVYEQHNFVCDWRCGHNVIISQHCMHAVQSV